MFLTWSPSNYDVGELLRLSPGNQDVNSLDRSRSKSRTQGCPGDASLARTEHRSPRPWETERISAGNNTQSES